MYSKYIEFGTCAKRSGVWALFILSILFPVVSYAQQISVPSSSTTGTYEVTVSNAYSWSLEEYSGSSWKTVKTGYMNGVYTTTKPNGTYSYRLRNCYPYGGCSYGGSRSITVNISLPIPSMPVLSLSSSDSDGYFSVSWNKPTNTTSFNWQERYENGAWGSVNSTTSLNVARTKTNGKWSYRVRACGSGGCSSYSSEKSIVIYKAPSAPSSIGVTHTSNGNFSISWSSVSGAAKYELSESANGGSSYTASPIYTGTSTSTSVKKSTAGDYKYRVRACSLVHGYEGCSGWRTATNTEIELFDLAVKQNYVYDALGRLTYVEDDREGMNRDYDYDNAGNRTVVAVGTLTDEESAPLYPGEPKNLVATYAGNCYYNISWAKPDRASSDTYYMLIDNKNKETKYTVTSSKYYCTYNTSPPDKFPVSLKACNSYGCSDTVKF